MYEESPGLDCITKTEISNNLHNALVFPVDSDEIQKMHLRDEMVNIAEKANDLKLKHIWEIEYYLKCPVVGTCLSIGEQRKILKKARHTTTGLKPYQIHGAIMERLNSKNTISLKLDKYLRHKYRKDIPLLLDLNEERFLNSWSIFFMTERMEALFFVAAIRKDLSDEFIMEIFGEIHILGHTNISRAVKHGQELNVHREANTKLVKQLNQTKERAREFKKKEKSLKVSLLESRALLQKLEANPSGMRGEKERNAALESERLVLSGQIREIKALLEKKAEQMRKLERQKRRLEIDKFDLQGTNEHLTVEISDLLAKIAQVEECTKCNEQDCPKTRLCDKRILIVGGITKMKHFYQRLIEKNGAIFEYHDGYMQNGNGNLEKRVRRCDLILCPVDCNSHAACMRVKKLGRKHKKPYKILRRSSLSAISNALLEIEQDQNMLQ